MPSWDIFEHQPQSYRQEVLPPAVKARIAVEQGSELAWERYVGADGPRHRHEDFGARRRSRSCSASSASSPSGRRDGHGAARAQVTDRKEAGR
jgi:Transketolase